MAVFSARPLAILDRVYRFVGGLRGLSEFDLAGSIQPVHDVAPAAIDSASRAAVTADATRSGLVSIRVPNTHVGAGTVYASLLVDRDYLAGAGFGINQDVELTLESVSCEVDTTAPSVAMAAIEMTVPSDGGGPAYPIVFYALTSLSVAVGVALGLEAANQTHRRIRTPSEFRVHTRTTSTAAGNVVWHLIFSVAVKP